LCWFEIDLTGHTIPTVSEFATEVTEHTEKTFGFKTGAALAVNLHSGAINIACLYV